MKSMLKKTCIILLLHRVEPIYRFVTDSCLLLYICSFLSTCFSVWSSTLDITIAGESSHHQGHHHKSRWPMSSRSISATPMGPTYHRRGSLQLWQFLLALLNDPANQAAIVWTGRGMEFKLIEPEEVS